MVKAAIGLDHTPQSFLCILFGSSWPHKQIKNKGLIQEMTVVIAVVIATEKSWDQWVQIISDTLLGNFPVSHEFLSNPKWKKGQFIC